MQVVFLNNGQMEFLAEIYEGKFAPRVVERSLKAGSGVA